MALISREYDHPVIEISENGCCYLDGPELDGRVPDGRRIAFHQQILAELARAIADGGEGAGVPRVDAGG